MIDFILHLIYFSRFPTKNTKKHFLIKIKFIKIYIFIFDAFQDLTVDVIDPRSLLKAAFLIL